MFLKVLRQRCSIEIARSLIKTAKMCFKSVYVYSGNSSHLARLSSTDHNICFVLVDDVTRSGGKFKLAARTGLFLFFRTKNIEN